MTRLPLMQKPSVILSLNNGLLPRSLVLAARIGCVCGSGGACYHHFMEAVGQERSQG